MKEQPKLITINNDGVYNTNEVIKNLEPIFGMSLKEIEVLLTNYKIIDTTEVVTYIENNLSLMSETKFKMEKTQIIQSRLRDYENYKNILAILQEKGLTYINILKYLSYRATNGFLKQESELILSECQINQSEGRILGRDLNRLLCALSNLIFKFQETLTTINNYNTYHQQSFSQHNLQLFDPIIPSTSLIQKDEEEDLDLLFLNDITSLKQITNPASTYTFKKVKKLEINKK